MICSTIVVRCGFGVLDGLDTALSCGIHVWFGLIVFIAVSIELTFVVGCSVALVRLVMFLRCLL